MQDSLSIEEFFESIYFQNEKSDAKNEIYKNCSLCDDSAVGIHLKSSLQETFLQKKENCRVRKLTLGLAISFAV